MRNYYIIHTVHIYIYVGIEARQAFRSALHTAKP